MIKKKPWQKKLDTKERKRKLRKRMRERKKIKMIGVDPYEFRQFSC
jgi:hypothetical protein